MASQAHRPVCSEGRSPFALRACRTSTLAPSGPFRRPAAGGIAMAGYVEDRWWRDLRDGDGRRVFGNDGKPLRERTGRFGKGDRYRARFLRSDGKEITRSFPDRRKRL